MLDRFRLNYRLIVDAESQVHVEIGRPPTRFVREVADVVRLHGIRGGTIECKGRGARARLRFGPDFPQVGRQAVRNVWQPPTGPGSGGGRRAAG